MTQNKPSPSAIPPTQAASPLRVVFAGTPEFAASVLAALIERSPVDAASAPCQIVASYTQPDRPAGRGCKLTPSPVKTLALEHGIPVYQPLNFRQDEDVAALAALKPDLMIVVAYGLILPQRVLDIPRLGCINVHASLLPRWRGAAPIQRALIEGDATTGITLMQMEAGLDTGPMLGKVSTPIAPDETSGQLHDRLAQLGAIAMADLLDQICRTGLPAAEVQDNSLATYAHKLTKEEGQIDWQQPAEVLCRKIRGLNPWPVATSTLQGDTVRLWNARVSATPANNDDSNADGGVMAAPGTILAADKQGICVQTGDGVLVLTELQLAGGKALPARDILNSRAAWFAPGERFGGNPADPANTAGASS